MNTFRTIILKYVLNRIKHRLSSCPDSLDDIKPRLHKDMKSDGADADDDHGKGCGAWGAEWTVRKAAASPLAVGGPFFRLQLKSRLFL